MQIHELNNFTGTLGSGAYLAIDDGTDTGKISSQELLAATEARIDNIIAGPAPSAEEIVDARLGADGVTYPSLGDAIRDQFTDVKADISSNGIEWVGGVYGDADGVITTTTSPYIRSKYKYPSSVRLQGLLKNWDESKYGSWMSLWKNGEYVGYIIGNKYKNPSGVTVNPIDFDELALNCYIPDYGADLYNIQIAISGAKAYEVASQNKKTTEDILDSLYSAFVFESGAYNTATGETASSGVYTRTARFNAILLDYIEGLPFSNANSFICLWCGGVYVGYKVGSTYKTPNNTTTALLVYDEVALCRYKDDTSLPHLITLESLNELSENAQKFSECIVQELTWQSGAYSMETGEHTEVDTYECSVEKYPKVALALFDGLVLSSGTSFLTLYKDSVYVGSYYANAYHNASGQVASSYDEFALNRYKADSSWNAVFYRSNASLYEAIESLDVPVHNTINVSTAIELVSAIDSIATSASNNKANAHNRYDIILAQGSYELYDAINLTRVTDGDTLFHRGGIELPDYVDLVGDGDVTISLTVPDADNTAERPISGWMSTINVYGTNTIKNIKIVANNCKYCVHDDSGSLYKDKSVRFENCVLEHQGMDTFGATQIPQPWAYGAGYDGGREGKFINCIFKSLSASGRAFYVHTSGSTNMPSPCRIYCDNCVFNAPSANEAIGLQVPWGMPIANGGSLSINNCVFVASKNIHLWGVKPMTLFGGGNTPNLVVTNENNSEIYLIN